MLPLCVKGLASHAVCSHVGRCAFPFHPIVLWGSGIQAVHSEGLEEFEAEEWQNQSCLNTNEYSGLISFMIDWLDLAVKGTLKSLLQHHSTSASAFFIVQLSHPYMTTGKTIILATWNFVGKVMSLLFNMLSRLAIAFLPRSKRLLMSWLQSQSTVTLEPPKIIHPPFPLFPYIFAMKWWD